MYGRLAMPRNSNQRVSHLSFCYVAKRENYGINGFLQVSHQKKLRKKMKKHFDHAVRVADKASVGETYRLNGLFRDLRTLIRSRFTLFSSPKRPLEKVDLTF